MVEKVPQPYIAVDRLAQVIDNVSKIRRATNLTLAGQDHKLTEKQTSAITSELHSIIDDIKMVVRYFEGTQNQ